MRWAGVCCAWPPAQRSGTTGAVTSSTDWAAHRCTTCSARALRRTGHRRRAYGLPLTSRLSPSFVAAVGWLELLPGDPAAAVPEAVPGSAVAPPRHPPSCTNGGRLGRVRGYTRARHLARSRWARRASGDRDGASLRRAGSFARAAAAAEMPAGRRARSLSGHWIAITCHGIRELLGALPHGRETDPAGNVRTAAPDACAPGMQ